MKTARLCVVMKMAVRIFLMLMLIFSATVCGCLGIALFIFANRRDWGAVFVLAILLMVSLDPEEMYLDTRQARRRIDHDI